MREIKFRAWDSQDKIITTMDSFDFYEDEPNNNEKIGQFFNWHYGCEIMQFTGILDKNGVEIYEGDIVKSICVVDLNTIEEYIGAVEYPKDDCGFYLIVKKITGKNGIRSSNYYTALKHHTNEIIGNIYENKYLLK